MKKLVLISIATFLAACHPTKEDKHHYPNAHHKNPALVQAMKECHHSQTDKNDMAVFEKCLKEKGFEKPANHPTMAHHYKHKNPKFAAAVKECHQDVKSTDDSAKFETCLKNKGFEKPANHPKTSSYH